MPDAAVQTDQELVDQIEKEFKQGWRKYIRSEPQY